jgi:hypothetical protein
MTILGEEGPDGVPTGCNASTFSQESDGLLKL